MPRSHHSRHAWIAAALAAVALLPSCGGWVAIDGRIAPAARAPRVPRPHLEHTVIWVDSLTPAAQRRLAASGRLAVLRERGRGFEPRMVAIAAGGWVRLENHDRVWHQAFGASPGGRFETAPARPGATRTVRFDSVGVVGVWCALHQRPAAVVRVLPHGGFVRADRNGRFRMPPLPPGTYRLHAWNPELGQVAHTVTISARAQDTLRLRLDGAVSRRAVSPRSTMLATTARRSKKLGSAALLRTAARTPTEAGSRYEPRLSPDS